MTAFFSDFVQAGLPEGPAAPQVTPAADTHSIPPSTTDQELTFAVGVGHGGGAKPTMDSMSSPLWDMILPGGVTVGLFMKNIAATDTIFDIILQAEEWVVPS